MKNLFLFVVAAFCMLLLTQIFKNKLEVALSGSDYIFDMTNIDEPFDVACFIAPEYGQFFFDGKRAFVTSGKITGVNPSTLYITRDNMRLRDIRRIEKGHNDRYLHMVLRTDESFKAFRIYRPGDHLGMPEISSPNLYGNAAEGVSYCTKNKRDVAQCVRRYNKNTCEMAFKSKT